MSSILLIIISIHRAGKMLNIGIHSQNKQNDQLSMTNEMNTIEMNTVETKTFETCNLKSKTSKTISADKDRISHCSFNRKESKKKSKKQTKNNASNNFEEMITADESSKRFQKTSDEESSKTDDCSDIKIYTSYTSAKVSFKIQTDERKKSKEKIKHESNKSSTTKFLNEDISKSTPSSLGAKSRDPRTKKREVVKQAPENQQILVKSGKLNNFFKLTSSYISMDILILISFILLSLMNVHFLIFLKVYKIVFFGFS